MVGHFPYFARDDDWPQALGALGHVKQCQCHDGTRYGSLQAFCFAEIGRDTGARAAIKSTKGQSLGGRRAGRGGYRSCNDRRTQSRHWRRFFKSWVTEALTERARGLAC